MASRAAAKERGILLLAAVCLLATLLLSPTAEASRGLPAAYKPALEPPATPDQVLSAELEDPPERLRLFDDLRLPERPLELVEARKTASGSSTFGLGLNVWQTGGLGRKCSELSFQGLWTDPVTGISYARNRWYDARTASWLSEDPLGAVDSPNLYAFVGWGPHDGRDPMGLRDDWADWRMWDSPQKRELDRRQQEYLERKRREAIERFLTDAQELEQHIWNSYPQSEKDVRVAAQHFFMNKRGMSVIKANEAVGVFLGPPTEDADYLDQFSVVAGRSAGTVEFLGMRVADASLFVASGMLFEAGMAAGSIDDVAQFADDAARIFSDDVAYQFVDDGSSFLFQRGEETVVKHGPLNPGSLADDVVGTFRSGTYDAVTSGNPTTLYRVYSDPARQLGPYWTRTRPQGPVQSIVDSALDPAWGNRATS